MASSRRDAVVKAYLEFATDGAKPGAGLMQDSYELFEAIYRQERP